MTASDPEEEVRKKKALAEFQDKSIKAAEEIRERNQRALSGRKEEGKLSEERALAGVQQEARNERGKNLGQKKWRKEQAEKKEEILQDKKDKAAEAARIGEKKKKEREYEDKQRAFFESFRAHEAEKVAKEREKRGREQDMKGELLQAEKESREAKLRADADELRTKNNIDHDGLRLRDSINREYRDLEQKLYAEEMRQRVQFQSMGPAGKPRLDEFLKQTEKRKAELRAKEQIKRSRQDQETRRKKTEAEAATQRKKAGIDADMERKKAELMKKIRDNAK